MDEREMRQLADEVVDGDDERAIVACATDPDAARELSHAVVARLVERASSHPRGGCVPRFIWPRAQDAIVALAAVPGADTPALAGALLQCCVREGVSGPSDQLHDTSLRLILDEHEAVVERLLRRSEWRLHNDALPWPRDEEWSGTRFLADAMWALHGVEGARWMDVLLDHDPHRIVSTRPKGWTPEDWTLRLDTLSDRRRLPNEAYMLIHRVLDPDDPAPREAAPALVRFACSGLRPRMDVRARFGAAANVLASHRTGEPEADVGLFWWAASTDDQTEALRWLLELSGPAGARRAVVDVAAMRGLVSPEMAVALTVELDRPLWADRDVPWVVTEVREEGVAEVPGDVATLLDGEARLLTRTIVAVHPRHGRADAAIETIADVDADPLIWEVAGARLWVARDTEGRAVRLVRDLCVLRLDLVAQSPPWHVHDRVPAGDETMPDLPETIDAEHLRELSEAGAPLRHQRHALREALRRRGVSEYSSAVILRHVRDGIGLMATDAPGRSRLGGAGRLPVGTSWPVLSEERGWLLTLLAELSLGELPSVAPLPAAGTLLIYQEPETWSEEFDPLVGTRVFYVPEDAALHDPSPPGDVYPVKEKPLRGVAMPIPGESELVVNALEFLDDRETTIAAMNELMDGRWPQHWLLGASLDVQGPSRHSVTWTLERASAESRALFTPEELDPGRWTLLAQVNEDIEAEIGIGDAGSFYLYILEHDLRTRRFDRVIGLMQCH